MSPSQPEGYLAVPQTGKGPGILVLHAWWGLNETMKEICDRLAGEGFVGYAPDLYHGHVATTVEEAEGLSNQLDHERAKADIAAAADLLWARSEPSDRGLGVAGFSLGASFALALAAGDPERVGAVALFYGTGSADFAASRAAYLGHYAQDDPYEPAEYVDWLETALQDAGRPVTFHHYDGVGHWFLEPDRAGAYDPTAAALAWERTLAFFRDRLVAG